MRNKIYIKEINKMTALFQITLTALVLFSFVMIVYVPVAYASPQNWEQSKSILYLGSGVWLLLVVVVAILNFFVV
jgi:photosystem II PsbZ protein